MAESQQQPWFLQSNLPVLFPCHSALFLSREKFEDFLQTDLAVQAADTSDVPVTEQGHEESAPSVSNSDFTMVDAPPVVDQDQTAEDEHDEHGEVMDMSNRMLTENGDGAFRSTSNSLVDLFYELETVVSSARLVELLGLAWTEDALATLKIIFNARSIHLGKSSNRTFYRAAGWLYMHHPHTLISNLQWLARPVIEIKTQHNTDASDSAPVLVSASDVDETDPAYWDVRNGASHGYWKDLTNLLALAANGKLSPLADPGDVLNVTDGGTALDCESARDRRHQVRDERHARAVRLFGEDAAYRGLHLAVARLFAAQLQHDLALLHEMEHNPGSSSGSRPSDVSLCAKWAPSAFRFHDKHTFVVSSIAEIMYPASRFPDLPQDDRTLYLRHAREAYRKDVSRLRARLAVVERDITAKTLDKIDYARVPSVAMHNYSTLFDAEDRERFDAYLDQVAAGRAQISGATLQPASLVHRICRSGLVGALDGATRVAYLQWNTLVQRIRDAGSLGSSIAVCDVSGSMSRPVFPDDTCPMDSSIALSMLVAEVAPPPFKGVFISFAERPQLHTIDLSAGLRERIGSIQGSAWGMSTNFASVFSELILPLAVQNKVKQEDMVKRVFVFSDMQFDAAEGASGQQQRSRTSQDELPDWSTSFARIKEQYAAAGYDMPELVFWNLAGGRAGYAGGTAGDPTAPKPVGGDQPGTTLVSGYSQAMLKVFMDGQSFADMDAADESNLALMETDGIVEVKRTPTDPIGLVKKAISHNAYGMLRVFD